MNTSNPTTPIKILMEDPILHTDSTPFCRDMTCPCHNDEELKRDLISRIERGEIDGAEALNIYWAQ